MKSQLAGVFVIAAVACGGRGGEDLPAPVVGTTDGSQIEGAAPGDDPIDPPQPTEAPALIDDPSNPPPLIEAPMPVESRRVAIRPTADPVPAGASAEAAPGVAQWRARAPQRYVISTCGTGFGPPSCSVTAVEEGRLVARSNRFSPDEPWSSAPIDDGQEPVVSLFEEAGRAIDGCTTSFQLDPVYAYPSSVYFDCGEEGWGMRVSCFEPDTLDVSRCQ